MGYKQYSIYGYTGGQETVINRISNNAADLINSEQISYPDKFDLYVNKENASIGGYSVTEEHALTDLTNSKVYLDHKVFVDATGGIGLITSSDGTLDHASFDVFDSSISFSTEPTASIYTITYTAASDKINDSHINAIQNSLMRVERTLGIKTPVGGAGTGIISLPLITQYSPSNQADLDNIKNVVAPNIVIGGHLESDLKFGSTDNSALTSYGGDGVNIRIGNAGPGPADTVSISAETLDINRGSVAGNLYYSSNTGDAVNISGCASFASQVTIGQAHGATDKFDYQGLIPWNMTGFYNRAALRVNGGIYFGAGMSGNGDITFVTTTGEKVDVVGNFEATDLNVEQTATFQGPVTFKDIANAEYPGYFSTNNEIELRDKNDKPTRIDGLDPSFAQVATESRASIEGVISSYLYEQDINVSNVPYASGMYRHPVHEYFMYPMLGGWTYTGSVKFAKAVNQSHKQVLLLESNLPIVSGGTTNLYGDYSAGLFNPGSTYLEINDGGSAKFAYPVYHHEAFSDGNICTGLNLYISADDNIHTTPSVVGQKYRIFQPSNAPVKHLSVDFTTPTAPTVTLGTDSGGYYSDSSQKNTELRTHGSFVGPSAGPEPFPVYKRLENNTTVTASLLTALQRSVDHDKIVATSSWGAVGEQKGIAYIFATTSSELVTKHQEVILRASPSPYGIAAANTWGSSVSNLDPGQWTPVGEIVASSTDGTSWTLVDTVSYRPNAFYDSCWVPCVNYRDTGIGLGSPLDTVPANLGRCLPIFGVDDDGGTGSARAFGAGEGDVNFFVEHNIGPVRSLSDYSIRIFAARHTINYEWFSNATTDLWESIHKFAQGSYNLETPVTHPYHTSHSSYKASVLEKGDFWELTNEATVRMFDTRFARISFDTEASMQSGGIVPHYIRVIVERIR